MQYHFIGIGGVGMSGLARILLQKGEKVQGSDLVNSFLVQDLAAQGATIFIGQDKDHIPENGYVVYSTDIKPDNPEYKQAQAKGLKLLHRSDCLQMLMQGKEALLVAGSHGKTTTSSLLAHMLHEMGEEPSYCIGGVVRSLGAQAGYGKGRWFVAEADESDGSFLRYTPQGAILTNIGNDHLPFWIEEKRLIQGFLDFYHKIENKQWVFWCKDNPALCSLSLEGVSYGFSADADIQIFDVSYLGWKTKWSFSWKGKLYKDIESPLIGEHNVRNATAVIGLCLQLGLSEEKIRKALMSFLGAKRRCEKKGEAQGIVFYDDYGHHPTEIKTTLSGIRTAEPEKRLVAVFQPHRFTRTRDCLDGFAEALQSADLVFVTDIYSAGEPPIEGIDAKRVYEEVSKIPGVICKYAPKETLLQGVMKEIRSGDLVVSIGAGDITTLGPRILQELL